MRIFWSLVVIRPEAEPRRSEVLMAGLATFNFKLSQLSPGTGDHRIDTCANPGRPNFGQPMTDRATRKFTWKEGRPDLRPEQLKLIEMHGPGA